MKYSDIKQALYNSEAMETVADGWNISVPFLCKVNNNTYDAFACTVERENARLVKLLMVDSITGKVDSMEPEQVAQTFDLDTLSCPADSIEDYDRYLEDQARYEELYDENHSELIRDNCIPETAALEMASLFGQLVGKILLQKIVGRIADHFLDKLKKSVKKHQDEPLDILTEEEIEEPIENAAVPKEE